MSIVNKTIRYTQPLFFPSQVVSVKDLVVECDDATPYANGMPVPTENNDHDWTAVFENFSNFPEYSEVLP